MEMNNSTPTQEPSSTSTPGSSPNNRNVIIAVVVALVLCCCCLVIGVGGYYGYQAYVKTQETLKEFENLDIPTGVPSMPDLPDGTSIPGVDLSSVPTGGLGDPTTRYTAWLAVQVVAMISDCPTPQAAGTTIEVTSQPDANGEWKETWNIDCGNGSSKPFNITFTPDANGVVNVNVDLSVIP